MTHSAPHYLLYLRTKGLPGRGRWQFRLERLDAPEQIEVSDSEPHVRGERLELLALVRALESLDQPSSITLVGGGETLRRGVQFSLPEWRENGWRWEYFGQMVPVKNGDLWQRLDRALQFHRVDCRQWRFDAPHAISDGCGDFSDQRECGNLGVLDFPSWKDWAREAVLSPIRRVQHRVLAVTTAVSGAIVGRWRRRRPPCQMGNAQTFA